MKKLDIIIRSSCDYSESSNQRKGKKEFFLINLLIYNKEQGVYGSYGIKGRKDLWNLKMYF